MRPAVVTADLVWTGASFASGIEIEIDREGRIAAVGALGRPAVERRRGQAILPGFVATHSHAFQRALRNLGETFPEGTGSFWTWREAMYTLVERLDAEHFLELTTRTFREMRLAGFTSVGEFHYLHHSDSGPDFAFDELVLEAARLVGIRLALVSTYYRTGGIGRALAGGQLRFDGRSLDTFWLALQRLAPRLEPSTQTLAVAAHSVRAVEPGERRELADEAARRGLPFHVHVEEQQLEIDDCLAAYGRRPAEMLLAEMKGAGWPATAIHCTHTPPQLLAEMAAAGWTICLCPTTEGNLGDGIPALAAVEGMALPLALGTDSNARISALEEMRWLEFGQRLAGERRGMLLGEDRRPARIALAAATTGGARALGLPTGAIAPGQWADLVAIDLEHPALAGVGPDWLLEALVFGAPDDVILATSVGGRFREHRAPWRERGVV